jgi:hypothetical protein
MREAAMAAGLPVLEPSDVNAAEARQQLAAFEADLLVVCDYGQILSPETLCTARYGGINLHGSLLPRHRGAAPVQWAILTGDAETGVSVIRMSPGLDAASRSCRRIRPPRSSHGWRLSVARRCWPPSTRSPAPVARRSACHRIRPP